MKKIILLLLLVMVIGLVACSGPAEKVKKTSTETSVDDSAVTEVVGETIDISDVENSIIDVDSIDSELNFSDLDELEGNLDFI